MKLSHSYPTMGWRVALATATVLSLFTLLPHWASASAGKLLEDCTEDEKIDGSYSARDYSKALKMIPADSDEYGNCREVIRRAQLAAASQSATKKTVDQSGQTTSPGIPQGTSGVTPGGSAPTTGTSDNQPTTPQEQDLVQKAQQSDVKPIRVGGEQIEPGESGFSTRGGLRALPTPLLVLAGLLSSGALAGVGFGLKFRLSGRGL